MAINLEWKAWVDNKYPGNKYLDGEIARIYIQEAMGQKVQSKKLGGETPNHQCPTCGGPMTYFSLCSMCELARATGNKAMWVCPDSVGARQKVNEMEEGGPGDRTYVDLFKIYKGIDCGLSPKCSQKGILTKEDSR